MDDLPDRRIIDPIAGERRAVYGGRALWVKRMHPPPRCPSGRG